MTGTDAGESRPENAEATRGSATADFLTRIGRGIRRLRKANGMTVQELAERASISRRLLTQVELGQANPSLVAVDRIARMLGTDFAGLTTDLRPVSDAVSVFPPGAGSLVWSSAAGSRAWLLAATESQGGAELWRWMLAAGDAYLASPDPAGSEELFEVHSGTLTITTGDGPDATVVTGATARLKSDRQYSYENRGVSPAEFTRVASVTAP